MSKPASVFVAFIGYLTSGWLIVGLLSVFEIPQPITGIAGMILGFVVARGVYRWCRREAGPDAYISPPKGRNVAPTPPIVAAPRPVAAPTSASVEDQLRMLRGWFEQGLIAQSDYDARRADVLARWVDAPATRLASAFEPAPAERSSTRAEVQRRSSAGASDVVAQLGSGPWCETCGSTLREGVFCETCKCYRQTRRDVEPGPGI